MDRKSVETIPVLAQLESARFATLRRLAVLVFVTVLLMWYLLTVFGYLMEGQKTGALLVPANGAFFLASILTPSVINVISWFAYISLVVSEEREQHSYAEFGDYDPSSARRLFVRSRIIDYAAILQIIYVWMSFAYIFVFTAETVAPGSFSGGSTSW